MIGVRIRELRQARNMTVRQLAEAAEISTGMISQVERDLTDPSLETLRRLARALSVPLFDLFSQEEGQAVAVVRRDRRSLVRSPNGGIVYSRLSPGHGRLEMLEGTLEPGGASSATPWSHPSEECVLVTEGRLVIELAGERHELESGDACYLDSRRPHRYLNESDGPVKFLVSVTPPSY
ncbi:helix-turn-helix domain-containing protein [Actinoallomurus acaciae]|uniref:Helix-turn-helix domain-containing protein n=1 Tax=Actinoallomurus acaciae TaxID=502577 RepID=A0ABV5YJ86_9ACTN